MKRIGRWLTAGLLLIPAHTQAPGNNAALVRLLEPVRQQNNLPALGGAIITSAGLKSLAVTGVRKSGTTVAATVTDKWHLGSDTKAMTAVVVATLVEHGQLTWETTIGGAIGDAAGSLPADFRAITLAQLLSHRSGLPANLPWWDVAGTSPSVTQQRLNAVKAAAQLKRNGPAGSTFEYSNLNYVIAGTMAERVTGKPWETLIREIVFVPLGMASCGFGSAATVGSVDQPWGHSDAGVPTVQDNPPVMGPAGTVHCSLGDWGKFVQDQLRGARGKGALLKPETYRALHTPRFGGTYGFGWIVTSRPWGGTVFTHDGSNTANYCSVWISPSRDLAVLVVTNRGGPGAQKAASDAAWALIQKQLNL